MKKLDKKKAEEPGSTVQSVLASLTPREAKVLRMKFGKTFHAKDQQDPELFALLQELVALKHKKKTQ